MAFKKVSVERWRQAQEWELKEWQVHHDKKGWKKAVWPALRPLFALVGSKKAVGDDWNLWWAQQFDNYRFLPSALKNYVELGCGPYTNTRLILQGRECRHAWCSYPLIKHYVQLRHNWTARAYHAGLILADDHPIEECPFASGYFDAVVMINVLDHVRDPRLCLREAARIVKKGGILILGQDLTSAEDQANMERKYGEDVGHPILLDRKDMETALKGFKPAIKKYLGREEGRSPETHYSTLIFAGRKR
jgi:SAM-dependent methyltransferase